MQRLRAHAAPERRSRGRAHLPPASQGEGRGEGLLKSPVPPRPAPAPLLMPLIASCPPWRPLWPSVPAGGHSATDDPPLTVTTASCSHRFSQLASPFSGLHPDASLRSGLPGGRSSTVTTSCSRPRPEAWRSSQPVCWLLHGGQQWQAARLQPVRRQRVAFCLVFAMTIEDTGTLHGLTPGGPERRWLLQAKERGLRRNQRRTWTSHSGFQKCEKLPRWAVATAAGADGQFEQRVLAGCCE